MKETNVKAVLSDGSSTLREWQEPYQDGLTGTIVAIKNIKGSINDYLTHLVAEEKVTMSKDLTENFDDNDQEEEESSQEEIGGDRISGLIKGMAGADDQRNRNDKRKSNYSNQAKKLKK